MSMPGYGPPVEASTRTGTDCIHIEPGGPWQNGYGESFNGKLRDVCLNPEYFLTLAQARLALESYRRTYNIERPHNALEYRTREQFKTEWLAGHSAG